LKYVKWLEKNQPWFHLWLTKQMAVEIDRSTDVLPLPVFKALLDLLVAAHRYGHTQWQKPGGAEYSAGSLRRHALCPAPRGGRAADRRHHRRKSCIHPLVKRKRAVDAPVSRSTYGRPGPRPSSRRSSVCGLRIAGRRARGRSPSRFCDVGTQRSIGPAVASRPASYDVTFSRTDGQCGTSARRSMDTPGPPFHAGQVQF